MDGAEVLTYPADVLIPAAMEVRDYRRQCQQTSRPSVVVEAANGPVTPEAHEHLHATRHYRDS